MVSSTASWEDEGGSSPKLARFEPAHFFVCAIMLDLLKLTRQATLHPPKFLLERDSSPP